MLTNLTCLLDPDLPADVASRARVTLLALDPELELDIDRLIAARRAVEAGYFSDQLRASAHDAQ